MNDTDYTELEKTVAFMRRQGVISLKMLGLEIELGPEPVIVPDVTPLDKPQDVINSRRPKESLEDAAYGYTRMRTPSLDPED